jgi:hypothetical protein
MKGRKITMSEDRNAVVYDSELAAMKDSRQRDMPVFKASYNTKGESCWIVAVSDHQAKMAMIDRVWPMEKYTKRERDERYTRLLELECEQKLPEPEVLGVVKSI